MPNYMQHSRGEWGNAREPKAYPGDEKMRIGCLQRIASTLEDMLETLDELADAHVPARKAATTKKEAELAEQRARWAKRDAALAKAEEVALSIGQPRSTAAFRAFVDAIEDGEPATPATWLPIAETYLKQAPVNGPRLVAALREAMSLPSETPSQGVK